MDKSGFNIISTQLSEFAALLDGTLQTLKIDADKAQKRALLLYLDKLLFWNKAYNLTAIKQPKEALIKHIFDCLTILPELADGNLLDIGTGAGLPGLIIAICQPERAVTVLDSNQKKIRFIRQLASELKITNVTPIASRVEQVTLAESDKFAVVTSRAFASLTDFVDAAVPHLAQSGILQAMKGLKPDDEDLTALSAQWDITTLPLSVPHLNETRHLVTLKEMNALG